MGRTPAAVVDSSLVAAGMVGWVGRSNLGSRRGRKGCRGRRLGGFGAGRMGVVRPVFGG